MPAILHLTVPQLSILTRTTYDAALLKEIEKHPGRFFQIDPARAEGETQMVRGENIALITPLTNEQLQAKLDKIEAGKKEAEAEAAAPVKAPAKRRGKPKAEA